MSAYGIAATYWILAFSLLTLGMMFLLVGMDALVKGKGDPPSLMVATFFGVAGVSLLYLSLNGFWDFAQGYTHTLDGVLRGWVQLSRLVYKFWQALRLGM